MKQTGTLPKTAITLVLAVMLAACGGQDLYRDVSEREANEMISVLMRAGIEADKAAGDDSKFVVSVAENDFADAVELLRQNGLPKRDFETLGTVFTDEGFTSSSLAERARLVYGLSEELSNTISQFDGVIEARVHLALPEADALTGVANPPSASVFVKYREGMDMPSQTAAIKALVTNSIEGLDYDKVSIAMTEARPMPAVNKPERFAAFSSDVAPIAALGGLALLTLGGWQFFRRRPRSETALDEAGDL